MWTTFKRYRRIRDPGSGTRLTAVPHSRYQSAVRLMPSSRSTFGEIAELGARARRVEGAALRVEVDAAAIDRRLDAQRHADHLAQQARRPERPHRQVHARRRDLQLRRDQLHELLERRVARAGEDVGAARRRRHRAAQPETFDQIVDERQVIERLPAADHRKASARQSAEHAQEARIARSIDADRTRHHHVEARRCAELARQRLGVELGFLVDVAGIERRVLGGRRIRDVTVHAAGAAMHDATDARGPRRLEHVLRAVDVDRAIRRIRLPRFAIGRGDVIHDLDAVNGAAHRRRVHQIAVDRRHALRGQRRSIETLAAPRPHQRPHLIAAAGQILREMSTCETGRAGHEDFHKESRLRVQSIQRSCRRADCR